MIKNSDHISKTDNTYCLNTNTNSSNADCGNKQNSDYGLQVSNLMGSNNVSFMATSKQHEHYVWEIRARSPNTTPASTVLNSPDLNTDAQYGLHPHQRKVQQIRVGRSPGSQFDEHDMLPQRLTSPGSPTDISQADNSVLRDGEIVVFDDIDTNWMNKTGSIYKVNRNSHRIDVLHTNEDVLKVTKMIGQLPIAEYEGSPRRFGNQSLAKAAFPKKPPGFPQRVSSLSGMTAQQQQQYQQQQEVAHARHQQMQRQHQFYAQATSSGGSVCALNPTDDSPDAANDISSNLIDIEDEVAGDNETAMKLRTKTPTFDYLYEFSETRKVLEEFFKANPDDGNHFIDFTENPEEFSTCVDNQDQQIRQGVEPAHTNKSYIGQRLAHAVNPLTKQQVLQQHKSMELEKEFPQQISKSNIFKENNDDLYNDSNSRSSGADLADADLDTNLRRHSRNFTLSPETTDYDSNCGDLDSLSNDLNCVADYSKMYASMPVLEDGLSSGHASDTENHNHNAYTDDNSDGDGNGSHQQSNYNGEADHSHDNLQQEQKINEQNSYNSSLNSHVLDSSNDSHVINTEIPIQPPFNDSTTNAANFSNTAMLTDGNVQSSEFSYDEIYASVMKSGSPARSNRQTTKARFPGKAEPIEIQEAMKEIRSAIQRAKTQTDNMKICSDVLSPDNDAPIWLPRSSPSGNGDDIAASSRNKTPLICDEDEQDTDLETDRLLGQQRNDDTDFFEDKQLWAKTSKIPGGINSNRQSPSASDITMLSSNSLNIKQTATVRQNTGTSIASNSPTQCSLINDVEISVSSPIKLNFRQSPTGSIKSLKDSVNSDKKMKSRHKEEIWEPAVLIEGVLFRARYLGSTQLVCEGQPTKSTRMMQAEEAVSRIKAPDGEHQPSTEVDLFISTEKIMVLNTDLKEIMMDHALRTISYIADIGDLVVLMARRRYVHSVPYNNSTTEADASSSKEKDIKDNSANKPIRTPKMICHVFESDEAQFIAQSIGQAFQVAYMEFLKANGIENENLAKEMDYQEVLNSQEIFGDELEIFAKKELQKEVVVPKAKGEILGVVIVESGWGSMLPTVVIANLMSGGAAARCGQLNIGDQLIAINGLSLVGLPLSTCQSYIRNAKNQTAVKFTVVPCPPVVEVKILRPKALFQLGFSVQNGVICSLLRGGIAERGGVRVGHRIIEINNQSVVAVPHDTIVKLLSSSVGEILMKTMPTSMFRLLTGQETPIYI